MVVLEQLEDAVDAGAAPAEGLMRSLTLDERTSDAATPADAPVAPGDTSDDNTYFEDAADSPEALAESYKSRGNTAFGRGRYLEAEELYSSAAEVGHALPQRAVYLANRAAARLHLGRYADAAEDCSASLEADPVYVKALMRRAMAYEKMEDLEHLELALADLRRVLELEASNRAAVKKLGELEAAAEVKREQVKKEMLDTLKGFGNSILGRFGLSLDNFKADKDPATGAYSVQFVQGGTQPQTPEDAGANEEQ